MPSNPWIEFSFCFDTHTHKYKYMYIYVASYVDSPRWDVVYRVWYITSGFVFPVYLTEIEEIQPSFDKWHSHVTVVSCVCVYLNQVIISIINATKQLNEIMATTASIKTKERVIVGCFEWQKNIQKLNIEGWSNRKKPRYTVIMHLETKYNFVIWYLKLQFVIHKEFVTFRMGIEHQIWYSFRWPSTQYTNICQWQLRQFPSM